MNKIIDIIPPKDNNKNSVRVVKKEKAKKSKKYLKITIPILVIFAIAVSALFLIEGNAFVTIYPKTEDVTLKETIFVLAKEVNTDFENNVFPGEYFEEVLDFEDIYEATGSDESATKATGTIRVYNEQAKTLKLVAGTRFLSSDKEFTYRAMSSFSIPGKTSEAGYIDVDVEADGVGDEYNLDRATFSIPGLYGSDYYTTTWAELTNDEKVDGGARSEVRVVTEKDLAKSEDLFKEKYLENAKNSLKNNLDDVGNYLYFDDAFEQKFDSFIILASENDKVDDFKIQGTITTKVLVFRKSDVDKFIDEKLSLGEEGREIVPGSLSKEFLEPEEDYDEYALVLDVSLRTYPKISNTFILNDIKGVSLGDCKGILENLPEVQSADVSASLFWKNKIPKNKDSIDLKINFDN